MSKLIKIALGAAMTAFVAFPAWADDLSLCLDKQVEACTRLIESGQNDKNRLANFFIHRGIAHQAKGEFDLAIADCSEAIRLDPHNAYAFFNRGNAHRANGEYSEAIADYTESLRLDPTDADLFLNRALALQAIGALDQAIADYSQVIRVSRNLCG